MGDPKKETKDVTTVDTGTPSTRFTSMVMREYQGAVSSGVAMDAYRQKLAQHLFVKIDMALKDAEIKRLSSDKGGTPYSWANVNLSKLALDAVHRVELGLDGLIPNHISPIAYKNARTGKYDIDLRIGYAGKDYYYRPLALYPIQDIIYELVYANDVFTVFKKGYGKNVESYNFEISDPFNRGEVVGGFGYVVYEDPTKNKLTILSTADFTKAKNAAQSKDFWNKHPEAMQYKTIVHRSVSHIVLDPRKISESFAQVESEELKDLDRIASYEAQGEIDENANNGEVIDIDPPEIELQEIIEPENQPQTVGPDF
ncbi:MAG: recombinase RecT [Proteobacteria bacterium]|nr:recombinase RecT [Pseudomonadota bacterium]MBU4470273.1 recombinase RecT [Pseudomonadota bacterium]MCG2752686.1 recombinase RecT [Desulfobacteraceae bacterium]